MFLGHRERDQDVAIDRDECPFPQDEARASHETYGASRREVCESARESGSSDQGAHEECQVQGQSAGVDASGRFPEYGQAKDVHSYARSLRWLHTQLHRPSPSTMQAIYRSIFKVSAVLVED